MKTWGLQNLPKVSCKTFLLFAFHKSLCPSTSSHRCANMGSNPERPYLQNAAFLTIHTSFDGMFEISQDRDKRNM